MEEMRLESEDLQSRLQSKYVERISIGTKSDESVITEHEEDAPACSACGPDAPTLTQSRAASHEQNFDNHAECNENCKAAGDSSKQSTEAAWKATSKAAALPAVDLSPYSSPPERPMFDANGKPTFVEDATVSFPKLQSVAKYQAWFLQGRKNVAAASGRPKQAFKWWGKIETAKSIEELEDDEGYETLSAKAATTGHCSRRGEKVQSRRDAQRSPDWLSHPQVLRDQRCRTQGDRHQ